MEKATFDSVSEFSDVCFLTNNIFSLSSVVSLAPNGFVFNSAHPHVLSRLLPGILIY